MKCMHCLIAFHEQGDVIIIGSDADGVWGYIGYHCPACKRLNLFLIKGDEIYNDFGEMKIRKELARFPIRPLGYTRPPAPKEVPSSISDDYDEACSVLSISPKASAALSRRCLQNLLRNAAKVKPGNLADEIQQVLDHGGLPSHLFRAVESIRHIGNFAAHPTKSVVTGEIIQVEPGEADWNLDVLESLFDFYYVQPQVIARKKEDLNKKLEEAGRNPMK